MRVKLRVCGVWFWDSQALKASNLHGIAGLLNMLAGEWASMKVRFAKHHALSSSICSCLLYAPIDPYVCQLVYVRKSI